MTKTKIIALYLPQFHEIEENNKWWGKGFTEWTSVKKTLPLFKGHDQPKIPYNSNYYTLDINTLKWQADLAQKHNVYGFCFYHYWFAGKKILEKPAEILLANKDIETKFCFSWANESWSRTWYSSKKELLIKQEYGKEKEWESHFNYLLPFFKDERYIKIDNKPLFLIYKPSQILEIDRMIIFWRKLAIKEGFSGIHITETLSQSQIKPVSAFSEAVMYYEPGYTLSRDNFPFNIIYIMKVLFTRFLQNNNLTLLLRCFKKLLINKFNYDYFNKKIFNRKIPKFNKKIYLGAFVNFDDTPRRKERAVVFTNSTPDKFEKYLKGLLCKSDNLKSEYLFLTAWNEWAEGAYLEPDEKNNFDYLKAIKKINDDLVE